MRPQEIEEEEKKSKENALTWASLCHFSALLGIIWWVPTGTDLWLPFGHIVSPLIVWLLKRKESPFVDDAGKESLNFQITMTVYGIILGALGLAFRGLSILVLLTIVDVVFVVIAGVRTSNGETYRYPLIPVRVLR